MVTVNQVEFFPNLSDPLTDIEWPNSYQNQTNLANTTHLNLCIMTL